MLIRFINFLSLFVVILLMISCSFDEPAPSETGTISGKTVPNTPQPSNNAIGQFLVLNLDWKSDTSAKFDIYLDTQNPPQIIYLKDADKKSVLVTGLKYGTSYYWRVVAKYTDGVKVESPVWKFTTLDSPIGSTGNGYALFLNSIKTTLPNNVNVVFQVKDLNGEGVTNLDSTNFEIYEDSQPLSPSESKMKIGKSSVVPYTIRTVLMLDNSTSLEKEIDNIRIAATTFINSLGPNQEAAIYQFSEKIEMLSDFTSSKNILSAALQKYVLGTASTDFYGAVKKGTSLWKDDYSIDEILQGAMIIFTDGKDTQGSTSLAQAVNSVHDKIVFSIGLGNEIEPEILKAIGTGGYYSINDVSTLPQKFDQIQKKISDYSKSFYTLKYNSPKRGNTDHILTIRIKDNPHIGTNSFITGTFSSSGFTSALIITN